MTRKRLRPNSNLKPVPTLEGQLTLDCADTDTEETGHPATPDTDRPTGHMSGHAATDRPRGRTTGGGDRS